MGDAGLDAAEGSVRDNVLIGKDGWLYLHSGSHDKFAFLTGERRPSDESIQNLASNLSRRYIACKNVGAQYLHLPMPSKPLCVPEFLPDQYKGKISSVFMSYYRPHFSEDIDGRVFYPLSELQGSKYFRKLDTHMNEQGNIHAAKLVLAKLGIDYDLDSEYRASTVQMGGDLATMMQMELKADEPNLEHLQNSLITIDNRDDLPSNTNHIRILHNAIDRSGRTLLVSGDSFALWLLRFLAPAFETVVYIRGPEFPYEFLHLYQPSHVISSSTERYLSQQSADGDNTSAAINCIYMDGVNFKPEFLSAMQALLARNYTSSRYRAWRGRLRAQVLQGVGIGPGRATAGMGIIQHHPQPKYRPITDTDGFEFRNSKFQPTKSYSFRCTVNVDRPSKFTLFFTTWSPGEQRFASERSLSTDLREGENKVEISLPNITLARMVKVVPATAGTTFNIAGVHVSEKAN